MKNIRVNTDQPYDILVDYDIIRNTGSYIGKLKKPCKICMITDDHVDPLYGEVVKKSLEDHGFDTIKYVIPNGEGSKSLETCAKIYEVLSINGITRGDLLVALGGGVVGDLVGFVAASYLRGIDFVQIPTTFLSQIDSSVGGKTGVNIGSGKNLVGAFWQPILVICDDKTLETISREIFCDGVGEAIKYGAIFDEKLFELIATDGLEQNITQVICDCINWKRVVVEQDEHDTGIRQLLNFGHTIGHAIEKCSNFEISHGKAIGIGMVMITRATEKKGITKKGTTKRLENLLSQFAMQTHYGGDQANLCKVMLGDKKRDKGEISFVVLRQIGVSQLYKVSIEDIHKFIFGEKD